MHTPHPADRFRASRSETRTMASPSSTVQLHVGAPALSSHPVSVRNPAGISIHESTRQELRPLLPRARLGAVAPDSARADSTGPPRARRRFRRRLRLDEASIESLIQESATRGKGRDRASRKSLRGSGGHSFVGGEFLHTMTYRHLCAPTSPIDAESNLLYESKVLQLQQSSSRMSRNAAVRAIIGGRCG